MTQKEKENIRFTCEKCGGSGSVRYVYRYNWGDQTQDETCPVCDGRGWNSIATDRKKIDGYDHNSVARGLWFIIGIIVLYAIFKG